MAIEASDEIKANMTFFLAELYVGNEVEREIKNDFQVLKKYFKRSEYFKGARGNQELCFGHISIRYIIDSLDI